MAVKMPLGLRIAIIDRAFRRKMDEWAEEIGITAVQLRVLGEVSLMEDNGVEEVNQKDLEHIEQVTHPTMTGIIKRLEAKSGELEFRFKYFIEKQSPVTALSSPMSYDCIFKGQIDNDGYKFILGVEVPVTTLCPCSKEISDNGAHNQRAFIRVRVSYDEDKHIWIEDLVDMVESCASCPVYPLLKREDEKFVTEKAYSNPKFVEDVLRDVVVKLRQDKIITEFEVECEAFESIHNHSAWAYQHEWT